MARKVEPFAPVDGMTVRLYTCGPTVYNFAHIGNFRTFLFEDLLRRAFELRGWRVDQAMNLTDVEDKIIAKAVREGVTIDKVTAPMIASDIEAAAMTVVTTVKRRIGCCPRWETTATCREPC